MAADTRGIGKNNVETLHVSRKWNGSSTSTRTSPERTRVWSEPNKASRNGAVAERRVPIVYYLSRNGHLEHPHFMEVPLSTSTQGLYLKDVINRLNQLRGQGMASLYSWSAKRSYKNGFVWHDLSEEDLIPPSNHHHEYVLKGTELLLLEPSLPLPPPPHQLITHHETAASSSFRQPKSSFEGEEDQFSADFPAEAAARRRRNQSWSHLDLNGGLSEYKVYKAAVESSSAASASESARAADAATQTEERRGGRRRRQAADKEGKVIAKEEEGKRGDQVVVRRGDEIEEVSPPPSDSSPETLESLMKADGRLVLTAAGNEGNEGSSSNRTAGEGVGRMKASTVLMQLISCGALSFRDCGATAVKEQGLALVGSYKGRLPRGGGATPKDKEGVSFPRTRLEDKEYFSGSLVETKKDQIAPALKRSNSCNADR